MARRRSRPEDGRANGKANGGPVRGARAATEARGASLPVLQKEATHPCFSCQLCCTYMAVEIDAPTTNTEYDYIVWYLYHAGVSVFIDWEGDWYLKVDSRCEHLTDAGLCGVYENRPVICREFSFEDCEKNNTDGPPDKWLFETAEQFITWLKKQRPKSYARFQAFLRQKKKQLKTAKALRRVKVTDLPLPLASARSLDPVGPAR
ncbi:MAG: YkgJ family cysteine cluster protein [Deltaproteobacteria bacterium]|nr:MAG: YkgJ family cysteine cluster protein [Deltaproteobacteria bacterium]